MKRGLAIDSIGSHISVAASIRERVALQKRHERSEELWKKLRQELLSNYNRRHGKGAAS